MLIDHPNGDVRVTADIPDCVFTFADRGVFKSVTIHNDHPIDRMTSRVIDDASIPAMVTHRLPNGLVVTLWPDGYLQVGRSGQDPTPGYDARITPDGIEIL